MTNQTRHDKLRAEAEKERKIGYFLEQLGFCLILIMIFACAFSVYYIEHKEKMLFTKFQWHTFEQANGQLIKYYGRFVAREGSPERSSLQFDYSILELENNRYILVDHHGKTLRIWTCYSEVDLNEIRGPSQKEVVNRWMTSDAFQRFREANAVKVR